MSMSSLLGKGSQRFSLSRSSSGDSQRFSLTQSERASQRASQRASKDLVPGLTVVLERAEGLPSADSNGLSDPYAVFRVGKLSKHKSQVVWKSLNPEWQETFFLPAPPNTLVPLHITIMDKDLIGTDDFLGQVEVDISQLPEDGSREKFSLELSNKKGKKGGRGKVFFSVMRDMKPIEKVAQNKKQVEKWADTGFKKVVVEVIKGMDLVAMDSNGKSDPFLKLKLGNTKHQTSVRYVTLNPVWQERFEFVLKANEPGLLEIECLDQDMLSRNDFMGKCFVDLDELPPNMANDNWYTLELEGKEAGSLHLLISVIDTGHDITLSKEDTAAMVGSIKVHVIEAKGLRGADLGGNSDPFCEVQLGNARLRTKTLPKTTDPLWDQLLELPVRDIFSEIELSVYDDDYGKHNKPDFLGKIVVPLLEIKNGDTQWFALKTEDCLKRAKGELHLAFSLKYKIPKAYQVAIKRREPNYMKKSEPFSLRRLLNAINRINAVNMVLLDGLLKALDLLNWKGKPHHSFAAAGGWALFCLLFRMWQIPLMVMIVLLIARVKNYKGADVSVDENGLLVVKYAKGDKVHGGGITLDLGEADLDDTGDEPEGEPGSLDEKDDDEKKPGKNNKNNKKKKQGLREQIRVLRALGKKAQDAFEFAATLQERFINLGNWSVPLLTQFVVLGCFGATLVLLVVPLNVLAMLAGLWQFFKRGMRKYFWKRSKYHVPIIEAVEFLGRVPSDLDKVRHARLPVSKELQTKKSAKIK